MPTWITVVMARQLRALFATLREVKLDSTHALRRIFRTFPRGHPLIGYFMSLLCACIFRLHEADVEAEKERLRKTGLHSDAWINSLSFSYWGTKHNVRRYIDSGPIVAAAIRHFLQTEAFVREDMQQLKTRKVMQTMEEQLKYNEQGQISDPLPVEEMHYNRMTTLLSPTGSLSAAAACWRAATPS